MTSSVDRREFTRIPVATRVKFQKDGKEHIWMTRDISEGGLYLEAETPPFVGEVVELEISLPSYDKLLKLKGEVVWRAQGEGCGIRFIRTTAAIRAAINEFVASINPS